MSDAATQITRPIAFILTILVIAILISLTGCRTTDVGRAADATERLGAILTANPAADHDDTRQIF